jgi:hypothetical protein
VYYRKSLSCEGDDQSTVNVNKTEEALRALVCPVGNSISHALTQILTGTSVGEISKPTFGRERFKERDGRFSIS